MIFGKSTLSRRFLMVAGRILSASMLLSGSLQSAWAQSSDGDVARQALAKACPVVNTVETTIIPAKMSPISEWTAIYAVRGEINQLDDFAMDIQLGGVVGSQAAEGSENRQNLMLLHSPGGSPIDVLKIHNARKLATNSSLSTLCVGFAHSSAASLLTLGDHRYALSACDIKFHRFFVRKKPAVSKQLIETSERIVDASNKWFTQYLKDELRVSQGCADHLMRRELTTVKPTDALKMNLIDGVLVLSKEVIDRLNAMGNKPFVEKLLDPETMKLLKMQVRAQAITPPR